MEKEKVINKKIITKELISTITNLTVYSKIQLSFD